MNHPIGQTSSVDINGKNHNNDRGGSCIAKNLIYAIKCVKCDKFYIGETGDLLRQRINGHRASSKRVKEGAILDDTYNDTGVAEHFGGVDHNFDRDGKLYVLENGNWDSPYERKQKEGYYICKYGTMVPEGLNKSAGTAGDLYGKIYRK